MDTVEFGKTGLRVSRLAFGTGTHGWAGRSQQTDLGVDRLADLLRLAYDHGVNFWDSADMYGSHPHVARALAGLPRDKVVIATKTAARSSSQVTQDVERFLRELGTDVLDVVLLHFMTKADWPRSHASAMEALSRAKEQGKVRAVGVSCHGLGPLRATAETDWAEVVLARINPAGVNMDAPPAKVVPIIEKLHASGKAVYGMKILGCGQLTRKTRAAIQYVLKLGVVHSMVIGTNAREQLLENVRLVEELAPQYPLR
ncbi:MAG: aldo/keto reductase [Anaerolineae bacterium]|jgi:aryl-alcohol dehydrogenase-like predicted oxidoreductase